MSKACEAYNSMPSIHRTITGTNTQHTHTVQYMMLGLHIDSINA
jgi:hypothetical protein